jgi:hypothetical protein
VHDFVRSTLEMSSNYCIHLTRWAVTALAEKHRKQDHRPGLPGPRRPQLAGDANVMRHLRYASRICVMTTLALVVLLGGASCGAFAYHQRTPASALRQWPDSLVVLPRQIDTESSSWELLVAGCRPEDINSVSLRLGSLQLESCAHVATSSATSLWGFSALPSIPTDDIQVVISVGGRVRQYSILAKRSQERPPRGCERMDAITIDVEPGTLVPPGSSRTGFGVSEVHVSEPILRDLLATSDVRTIVRWSDLIGSPSLRSGGNLENLRDRYSLMFYSAHQVLAIWELLRTSPAVQGVHWVTPVTNVDSFGNE